jgi:AraC-like DNA-binding protein
MDRLAVVETPPDADLDGLCRCTYVARFDGGRYELVPDGCIDLLWRSDGSLVVCGPETDGWSFEVPAGSTTTGVRLEAGIAPALLRTSADELRDQQVSVGALLPGRAGRRVVDRLGHAGTLDGQRRVLVDLVRQLADDLDDVHDLRRVPATIAGADPGTDLAAIARDLGMSRRQLHRSALRLVGYGPSMFRRVTRVQRALRLIDAGSGASLTAIASRAGFADHAHMTREFRAIAHMTPSQAALPRSRGGTRPTTASVAA